MLLWMIQKYLGCLIWLVHSIMWVNARSTNIALISQLTTLVSYICQVQTLMNTTARYMSSNRTELTLMNIPGSVQNSYNFISAELRKLLVDIKMVSTGQETDALQRVALNPLRSNRITHKDINSPTNSSYVMTYPDNPDTNEYNAHLNIFTLFSHEDWKKKNAHVDTTQATGQFQIQKAPTPSTSANTASSESITNTTMNDPYMSSQSTVTFHPYT